MFFTIIRTLKDFPVANWVVIHPTVFAEAAMHNWFGLKLGVIELYLNLDAIFY